MTFQVQSSSNDNSDNNTVIVRSLIVAEGESQLELVNEVSQCYSYGVWSLGPLYLCNGSTSCIFVLQDEKSDDFDVEMAPDELEMKSLEEKVVVQGVSIGVMHQCSYCNIHCSMSIVHRNWKMS